MKKGILLDWTKFNAHGESPDHAFETLCNILFLRWCNREYKDRILYSTTVNGAGGDGGVEAYAVIDDDKIIAVQSKWFRETIGDSQIRQIKKSVSTAIENRPKICRYIVCVPRDLTSQRIGKGRKPIKNTEESRWTSLREKVKEQYPGLELELWNETRLLEELQNIESIGTRLYYFENCEITEQLIRASFDKAIAGWARTSYIVDLYTPGFIHEQISIFVRNVERNREIVSKTENTISDIKELLLVLERLLLWIDENDKDNSIRQNLEKDKKTASSILDYFIKKLPVIRSGEMVNIATEEINVDFICHLDSAVNDSFLEHKSYFHINSVRSSINRVIEDINSVSVLLNNNDDNRLIFTGNPGTGKTVGIVSEIERIFDEDVHLPILIHAKDHSRNESWKDILVQTLGLNSSWTEDELFQSLEAAAFAKECHNLSDGEKEAKVCSKVVICVDGLDESKPFDYWEERIHEALSYKFRFKRTFFIFLTRPYALKCQVGTDLWKITKRISPNGDANLEILVDLYFNYYNIDLNNNSWIKAMLTTPFMLKIFCDIFKGRSIEKISENQLIVTKLIDQKISDLEKGYTNEYGNGVRSNIIRDVLIKLSSLFVEKRTIKQEDIISAVDVSLLPEIHKILEFLNNQGFLYCYTESPKDILQLPTTYYTWGMQPTLDYLIAYQVYNSLISGADIPINYDQGIFQMLSLLLLEKKQQLIHDFKSQLPEIEGDEYFETICYSLAHISPKIAGKHRDFVYSLMKKSPKVFRNLTNRIILPASRIKNHPLGGNLFNEFLTNFNKPAERDIWLAIPANLYSGYEEDWFCDEDISFERFFKKPDIKDTDYPLIACWLLSSVDNSIRTEIRIKLTGWGITNPEEFFELFLQCITINDPQIREDLLSVAYGISLSQFIDDCFVQKLADWICNNIFSDDGLSEYCDADIRYYSRGIVEIAANRQLIDNEKTQVSIPPYKSQVSILPIAKEALGATRMGGYWPIDYDLARYVLCDEIISDFFCEDYSNGGNLIEEAIQLLHFHKEYYNLETLPIDAFIISAAYHYLLEKGWTESIFSGVEGHKGVDSAIRGVYYSATHGMKSKVMTVAEKYVWCAKSKIMAFFADMLPFHDYEDGFYWLDDYSELKNYLNPLQERTISFANMNNNHPWIHTESMAIPLVKDEYTENAIRNWMVKAPLPDFGKWIQENDSDTLLYAYTNIENKRSGISEIIIISSGIIESENLDLLVELIDSDMDMNSHEVLDVEDFQSHQKGSCYCSPQEVCVVNYKKELYSKMTFSDREESVTVHKALSRCLIGDGIDTEKEFKIPGRILRSVLGITFGDGYQYYNKQGDIVCQYIEKNSPSACQYSLLADRTTLTNGLLKNNYRMFWLFRVCRRPSSMAHEYFPKLRSEADHVFLIWFDDENECHNKYIDDSNLYQGWNLPFEKTTV